MKKYLAVFRIRFANSLQYRFAALAGLITQFVWGGMRILAFRAFYKANPAAFPMTFSQTVSYIWLQQALLAMFMLWFFESEIFNAISDGGIVYELARPINLYNRWFWQSVANRLAKTLLRCVPLLLVAFLVPEPYRMSLPQNIGQFLLFIFSAILSLGVVIAFSMFIYISAFYTLSSLGMRIISASIADFLSGAIVPIPFFPESIRTVTEVLPFASMQNMPLRIYVGDIAGTDIIRGIGLQIFWLVTLIICGKLLMKKALRRVVVQGG